MATKRTTKPTKPRARPQKPRVAILTGSPNDLPTVEKAKDVLDLLGIPSEIKVLSAHRTPERVHRYVERASKSGVQAFIACAGMANHLAGTVAALTRVPVIGVPLSSGSLDGLDALLSTVQMPPGVPVATVGIDGTKNAAYLAARIVALGDASVGRAIDRDLKAQRKRYDEV